MAARRSQLSPSASDPGPSSTPTPTPASDRPDSPGFTGGNATSPPSGAAVPPPPPPPTTTTTTTGGGGGAVNDSGRELFEACRNGDVLRVKRLVDSGNVNAKDMAGRKSTPLHFAA
eukprot:g31474.t1